MYPLIRLKFQWKKLTKYSNCSPANTFRKRFFMDCFAEVHSFWDKWEKPHDDWKHFGFFHVFGRHAVFPIYHKNYALKRKSPGNHLWRVLVWLQFELTLCELCTPFGWGVITRNVLILVVARSAAHRFFKFLTYF